MQKQLMPLSANRQGSILVGVVALTVVMSLAAFGFIQISGSMSNNGAASLEDTKAFYAVESGLLMGARYLRVQGNFNTVGSTPTALPFSPVTINGNTVVITVERPAGADSIKIVAITSNTVKGTGYKKQMTWQTNSNLGQYAFVMGKEHPDCGLTGQDWDWNGWGASNRWIGRLHMNSRIKLGHSTGSYTFSGGPVTVSYNPYESGLPDSLKHMNYTKRWTDAGRALVPNINGYLNDFNNGVALAASSSSGHADAWNMSDTVHNKLNTWFQDRFTANQPAVELLGNYNDFVWNSAPGNVTPLPTSEKPGGGPILDGPTDYRPTLYFNEAPDGSQSPGRVTYRYYQDGDFETEDYPVNGRVFKSNTSVNVLGVVQGKTTVVTTANASIVIVADERNNIRGNSHPGIVYLDYTIVNGLPKTTGNDNVLGLVSGKNIVYNKRWKRWDDDHDEVMSTLQYDTDDDDNYLNVCGSIIATNTANACDSMDITTDLNYAIRAYGSHVVNAYRTHSQGGNGTGGNNNLYVWDERLTRITYPNSIDRITNASGLLVLNYFSWKEENL